MRADSRNFLSIYCKWLLSFNTSNTCNLSTNQRAFLKQVVFLKYITLILSNIIVNWFININLSEASLCQILFSGLDCRASK